MEQANGHFLKPGLQYCRDGHEHRSRVDEKSTRLGKGETTDDAQRMATPTKSSPDSTTQKQWRRGGIFSAARDKMQKHTGHVKPDQPSSSPREKYTKGDKDRKQRWQKVRRRTGDDSSQSSDNEERVRRSPTKWPSKRDWWTSSNNDGVSPPTSREKLNNGTNSSTQSSSISPMSGQSSSITDWEDRFVVNMPSAKDPNPPTMSTKQISEFQRSIENVYLNGETMLDPETPPNPRTTTPEQESSPKPQPHQISNVPKRKGVGTAHAIGANKNISTPTTRRYYSPDDVGKSRHGTIREESSSRPNQTAQEVNFDGSFLGCKEVNGPYDKNPDEILLFPTIEEETHVLDEPSPAQNTTDGTKKSLDQGKTVVQDEHSVAFQNSRRVPCSKSSPKTIRYKMKYRKPPTTQASSHVPGKENTQPTYGLPNKHDNQENCQKDDDVFIITPTIRHTMVTIKGTEENTRNQVDTQRPQYRPPGQAIPGLGVRLPKNSTPSGLQPGIQNSQAKSTAPYTASSKTGPIGNTPVMEGRAAPDRANMTGFQNTRGYIPISGMARSSTENFAGGKRNNYPDAPAINGSGQGAGFGRSASDSSQFTRYSHLYARPTTSNARRSIKDALRARKWVEVAELDGQQVDNHRPTALHSQTTDCAIDVPDLEAQSEGSEGMFTLTLSLVFNIFVLSVAQVLRLSSQYITNSYIQAIFTSVLTVVENCWQLLKRMFFALSIYKTTGSWPKPRDKDLGHFMAGVSHDIANLIALAFLMMVVGRLAWYVVLVGSWVVWFAKPFGWMLSMVGRVVLA